MRVSGAAAGQAWGTPLSCPAVLTSRVIRVAGPDRHKSL